MRTRVVLLVAVVAALSLPGGPAGADPGDVVVPGPNAFLGPTRVLPLGGDVFRVLVLVSARPQGPLGAGGAYGFKLFSDGPLTVVGYSRAADPNVPCTGLLGWTDGGVPAPVGPALDAATVQFAGHVCSGDVSVDVSAPASTVVWYASAIGGGYSNLRLSTVGPGPYVHPCNCVTVQDAHGMGDVVSLR